MFQTLIDYCGCRAAAGTAAAATAPPALSEGGVRRVAGDTPLKAERLEEIKLGVVRFVASGVFGDQAALPHLVVAAADTRFRCVLSSFFCFFFQQKLTFSNSRGSCCDWYRKVWQKGTLFFGRWNPQIQLEIIIDRGTFDSLWRFIC